MKDLIKAAEKYKTYKGYSRYFDLNIDKYTNQTILKNEGYYPARKELFKKLSIESAEGFYSQFKKD